MGRIYFFEAGGIKGGGKGQAQDAEGKWLPFYEGKIFLAGKMTLKKCLRQPPAGRVSPEQPVGGKMAQK